MTRDKLNVMLHRISTRPSHEPGGQAIRQHVDALLDSRHQSLPALERLGSLLLDAGHLDEAKEAYTELEERFQEEPIGFAGMAQVAMRRGAWREALVRWNEVAARFRNRLTPSWLNGRATTLLELGSFEEAEVIFRRLAQDYHDHPQGFVGLARLAMSRGLWTDALILWDDLFARFENYTNLSWHAGRATTLGHLGRLDEALDTFQRLASDFATRPPGFVGLAEIAMQKCDWQQALVRWDEVMSRFPTTPQNPWQSRRANVFVELGRPDEAESVFRQMIEADPESRSGWLGLLRVLFAKDKADEALVALDSSPFQLAEIPAFVHRRLDILLKLTCGNQARVEFERLLLKSVDPAVFDTLMGFVPRLYERWRRTEVWLTLLRKVEALLGRSDCKWTASFTQLRARLLLALRDYEQFLALINNMNQSSYLGVHQQRLLAVAAKLRQSSFPDYEAPKVFGIGLPKTGTTSLAAALTILGFNTLDWMNPLTHELLSESDFFLFDAFTDSPVCVNFEKYYYMFPNSRFIYTVRPFESWHDSQTSYFIRLFGYGEFEDLKSAMARKDSFHYGTDFTSIHMSLFFNHADFEEAYDAYDLRVRQFFRDKPQGRFLELSVSGGGWEELCTFTGKALPSTPFPWLNRKPGDVTTTPGERQL